MGNPLDYTALIWGEVETLRDIVAAVGADPAIDQLLVLYDQPVGIERAAEESWAVGPRGHPRRAPQLSPVPVMVASTLPELLDDAAAAQLRRRRRAGGGRPAHGPDVRRGAAPGARRSGPPARAGRGGGARPGASTAPWRWPSTRPRTCFAARASRWSRAGWRPSEEDLTALLDELGAPLVLKLSAPALLHKSELGALALDLRSADDARAAHRRLLALEVEGAVVLVERMAATPAAELIVAARRDGGGARARGRPGRDLDRAARRRGGRAAPGRARARGGARCARCAARRCSAAVAAARRSTWAPPPGWPPRWASCCSRAGWG